MDSQVLSRALFALLISVSGLGLYFVVNRILLARLRGRRLGLEAVRPGAPAILYFTTPTCQPCRTIQRPALAKLQERLGDKLQVITVDASQRLELADYWGVLSVPTTFIIDSQGRPRCVNHGVTSTEKLLRQIEEVEQNPGSTVRFPGVFRRLVNTRNTQ